MNVRMMTGKYAPLTTTNPWQRTCQSQLSTCRPMKIGRGQWIVGNGTVGGRIKTEWKRSVPHSPGESGRNGETDVMSVVERRREHQHRLLSVSYYTRTSHVAESLHTLRIKPPTFHHVRTLSFNVHRTRPSIRDTISPQNLQSTKDSPLSHPAARHTQEPSRHSSNDQSSDCLPSRQTVREQRRACSVG